MRAFEFLTEGVKGFRNKKYRDGGKPDWYEKAVQLKTDNPRMSAAEIGRQVGVGTTLVLHWLIGKPDSRGYIYNDNPPFTQKDFPNIGHKKYFDGAKPEWYEKAVQLKTDNPRMSAAEISRQLGIGPMQPLIWLTGQPDGEGRIYNDNPPFTQKDFPITGAKIYFDGEKPEWYEEAVAMRKQGMIFPAIANKFSTPEKKISVGTISNWLVKGRKYVSGKLINPDAPFEPRPKAKRINTDLIKELILDPDLSDADIIELIADEKGNKIASQVRAMLPKLRQKLNPGTQVIDKTRTGSMKDPDITGFVQETS